MITTKIPMMALACIAVISGSALAMGGADAPDPQGPLRDRTAGPHRAASLQNAGFESGKSYWTLAKYNGGRARYSLDTLSPISGGGSALVHVQGSTGRHGDVQLFQPYALRPLTEYRIHFHALVTDTAAVLVAFANDEEVIWSAQVELLPGRNFYGPYRYFSEKSAPFALFAFHLGQTATPVRLDSVAVTANSSALAYHKRASQPGLNIKTLLPGLLHVEIPFPHRREVPLVVTDQRGRLLTSEIIAPGTTGKQIRIPAADGQMSIERVVLNLYMGERVLIGQFPGTDVWPRSSGL